MCGVLIFSLVLGSLLLYWVLEEELKVGLVGSGVGSGRASGREDYNQKHVI